MQLDTYQKHAEETAIYPEFSKLLYPILGLSGESGELVNKLKKLIRDDNMTIPLHNLPIDKQIQMVDELGDILWYVALIARDLHFSLSAVARRNLAKLKKREKENKLKGEGDDR